MTGRPHTGAVDSSRSVAIVAFPDTQVLDVTGPLEVFALANRLTAAQGQPPPYVVEVVAEEAGPVTTSSGLAIVAHRSWRSVCGPLDTLVVAGGIGVGAAVRDGRLPAWLRGIAPSARRVASVCNGAFLLAEAGLLDGRRATTHWVMCDRLARRYSAVTVETDPIFVRDGNVTTSAGVTAGMDLALAFVDEDLGRETALTVARWMVLFIRRPGGQSQFSAQLAAQAAEREPLRDLQAWIADHPSADLTVEAMAERAAMSARNFARVFRRETSVTPAAYVERVRVEVARRLLETTDCTIDEIARSSGFGTPETLRRAFARRIGVAPGDYRERFRRNGA
jgi:transcriptional regulator GlxA family with amidase domain